MLKPPSDHASQQKSPRLHARGFSCVTRSPPLPLKLLYHPITLRTRTVPTPTLPLGSSPAAVVQTPRSGPPLPPTRRWVEELMEHTGRRLSPLMGTCEDSGS